MSLLFWLASCSFWSDGSLRSNHAKGSDLGFQRSNWLGVMKGFNRSINTSFPANVTRKASIFQMPVPLLLQSYHKHSCEGSLASNLATVKRAVLPFESVLVTVMLHFLFLHYWGECFYYLRGVEDRRGFCWSAVHTIMSNLYKLEGTFSYPWYLIWNWVMLQWYMMMYPLTNLLQLVHHTLCSPNIFFDTTLK